MKERPMLFNGDMVRAILAGRKTQTRRPVKIDMANAFDPPRGKEDVSAGYPLFEDVEGTWHKSVDCCPFGQVGDRLWVRETWAHDAPSLEECRSRFEDLFPSSLPYGPYFRADSIHENTGLRWRPSIHMPRWASRITLEITGIRVERVQDISEYDAIADGGLESMIEDHIWYIPGTDPKTTRDPIYAFEHIWNSCYSARALGWDVNPWVWVVEFKKVNQ